MIDKSLSRQILIKKLFNEFETDKNLIKQNLMLQMDTIVLEAKNEFETATLTISIKKK